MMEFKVILPGEFLEEVQSARWPLSSAQDGSIAQQDSE